MSSKEFTKKIFTWLAQVKGDHASLLPSAALAALELIEYFNEDEGGTAWPSCKTIASGIGRSEATVIAIIHQFEQRGHLRVEWGKQGRGHSNRYWMIIKPQQAKVSDQRKPQQAKVSAATENLSPLQENLSPAKIKPQPAKETLSYRTTLEPSEDIYPPDFENFWNAYPRKKAKRAAERAYQKILSKKLATADELIAGAERYAIECANEPPKYTLHASNWLNDRRWTDAPEPAAASLGHQLAGVVRALANMPDHDDEGSE